MWRGSSTNFSMKTRSSPKLALASLRHEAKPSSAWVSFQATRKSLAAAARRRLDHHRVADLPGDLDRQRRALDRFVVAGDRADAGLGGELLRLDLVAHRRDRRVLRADEDDALLLDAAREGLVLGQEAVAGMDRVGAGLLAGGDDLVHRQVGLAARRRADEHRLVGELDVERVAVGLGVHGDRGDAQPPRRLDDAAGDLAAVGDQDLLEHAIRPIRAECCRACATGRRPSCRRASRASGRCASSSRAAGSRRRRSRARWR